MAIISRGNKNNILGTVVALDSLSETVRFCCAKEDTFALPIGSAGYKVRSLDLEFYDRLSRILKQQVEKNPEMDLQKTSVILPDRLFLLDMVTIPIIHRKAMQQSLSLAIESIYKNADELHLMTYTVQQTKQSATFGMVGIRQDILSQIRKTFAANGFNVAGITYASNATVNGAIALNPKLRNETFLLLDIKENYSRFAFVVRGCTMGYYDLPFGCNALYKSRLASEDTLFDHRAGELLVLNAIERARAKQLTMEGGTPEETPEGENPAQPEIADGILHKGARKLPKFMQRPVPQTREEFLYENFRIFLKWTLDLITNNSAIVSLEKMNTVYVNIPEEYHVLFPMINKRKESHGVTFEPLLTEDTEEIITQNLELYGGFFMNRFNSANTF